MNTSLSLSFFHTASFFADLRSNFSVLSRPVVHTMPAIVCTWLRTLTLISQRREKKKTQILAFYVDLTAPCEDNIFTPEAVVCTIWEHVWCLQETFLKQRIKVNGKAGQLGNQVSVSRFALHMSDVWPSGTDLSLRCKLMLLSPRDMSSIWPRSSLSNNNLEIGSELFPPTRTPTPWNISTFTTKRKVLRKSKLMNKITSRQNV